MHGKAEFSTPTTQVLSIYNIHFIYYFCMYEWSEMFDMVW